MKYESVLENTKTVLSLSADPPPTPVASSGILISQVIPAGMGMLEPAPASVTDELEGVIVTVDALVACTMTARTE